MVQDTKKRICLYGLDQLAVIKLLTIIIFALVLIFVLLWYNSKNILDDKIIYQEKVIGDMKLAISNYIFETNDYQLKLNSNSTVTLSQLLKALQEEIRIGDKVYGPYLGKSPGGGLNYTEILQNKGLKIYVSKEGSKVNVNWSDNSEIIIQD